MGNRAIVIFHDANRVSPSVYLHWCGGEVPAWLKELKLVMKGRENDAEYAAARFIGICHNKIEGNLSLGVISNRFGLAEIYRASTMRDESPGDAGVVIVDTRDFSWKGYGGYLACGKRRRP